MAWRANCANVITSDGCELTNIAVVGIGLLLQHAECASAPDGEGAHAATIFALGVAEAMTWTVWACVGHMRATFAGVQ